MTDPILFVELNGGRTARKVTRDELVRAKEAEKWNGQLPTTVMGNAVPMINLGK